MRIKAIVINTFREAARNKIFYLLIIFGVLFAFSSKILSLLTIGDSIKVLKDVGLASINFFCVLIAIFTGINLIFKEIDKRTIYNILSKPISRNAFILGKFLGLALTLLVAMLSMSVIFIIYIWMLTGSINWLFIFYFLLLYMELLIIVAVSLFFSTISSPILASIFTILFYLIGHLTWTFNEFKYKITAPVAKFISQILYYLLPNLEKLNLKSTIVMDEMVDPHMIFISGVYALIYLTAILLTTMAIFKRKEFQ